MYTRQYSVCESIAEVVSFVAENFSMESTVMISVIGTRESFPNCDGKTISHGQTLSAEGVCIDEGIQIGQRDVQL
jgi:hypothetical protein